MRVSLSLIDRRRLNRCAIVFRRRSSLQLRHAPGVTPLLANRPDPARRGRVHVPPRHAAGRLPQAGDRKLQSTLAVEGELPDDGEDLMMALARKMVSGEEAERNYQVGGEWICRANGN